MSEKEMKEPPTYVIETVSDFLTVPDDRIAICLEEFAAWVESAKAMTELCDAVAESVDPRAVGAIECRRFVWIDDGLRNVTIELEAIAD